MNHQLPVFDVPRYNNSVAGGALAVAMAAAKRPLLDLRDMPNPPTMLAHRQPS